MGTPKTSNSVMGQVSTEVGPTRNEDGWSEGPIITAANYTALQYTDTRSYTLEQLEDFLVTFLPRKPKQERT